MGKPLRDLLEECREGRAIRLLRRELPDGRIEGSRQLRMLLSEIIGKRGAPTVKLVPQGLVSLLGLCMETVGGLLESGGEALQLPCQEVDRTRSTLLLAAQASDQGLHFIPNVLFQGCEPILQVGAQLRRFGQQLRFELCEPALVVSYLGAEQDVANFCEVIPGCVVVAK